MVLSAGNEWQSSRPDTSGRTGTVDWQAPITRLRALGYTGALGAGDRPTLSADAPPAAPRDTPGF